MPEPHDESQFCKWTEIGGVIAGIEGLVTGDCGKNRHVEMASDL